MTSLTYADTLAGLALIFAFFLTWNSVRKIANFRWDAPMGGLKWDPKESWASTLTAVGAILGTVTSTPLLLPKDTRLLSKAEFSSLSLFFGALTIIAAFLYNATRREKRTNV